MNMIKILKTLMPESIKKPLKEVMGFKSMEGRLLSLKNAGFQCQGAIDVGAYHGEWTKGFRSVWNVPVIMVEPQLSCSTVLKRFTSQASGAAPIDIEFCALGKCSGTANFILSETNSRISITSETNELPSTQVPIRTLIELIKDHPGKFDLLKADVQGFELDVLEGTGELLQQFEVIILEVSIIRIGPVPTFYEVMQYMDKKGYRLYDFLPMYYRPLDNALWQGDAFFVRNNSSLVSSLKWN